MSRSKFVIALVLVFVTGALVAAQDKSRGGIKGKVRVETGKPSDIAVIVRQGEREVTQTTTNAKGEFTVSGLEPGVYSVTFRKPGLTVGTRQNVEVRAGKVRELSDRLVLTIDEASIAFLRGSVFDPAGRSVRGARVDLMRVEPDGSLKKLGDPRFTSETGQFVFRVPPDKARYRLTVKIEGAEDATKDVEVDDAVVYRIALTLEPVKK